MIRYAASALLIVYWIVFCANGDQYTEKTVVIPPCPEGHSALQDGLGRARKCLPHHNDLCLAHLPADTTQSVCCWFNKVDYHCCIDVPAQQCSRYENVTVVVRDVPGVGGYGHHRVRRRGVGGVSHSTRRNNGIQRRRFV